MTAYDRRQPCAARHSTQWMHNRTAAWKQLSYSVVLSGWHPVEALVDVRALGIRLRPTNEES
jgi:hypothetical protein